jgi:multiple sugar transport system substrate-binding protein
VATAGVNVADAFGAGKSAINTNGSWVISQYFGYQGVDIGLAPTPIGPTGKRASMFNGLADAIYAGSDEQEAAWQWVKFMASPECQTLVGQQGVVFPAIPEATELAKRKFAEKGIDVTAFTVHVEDRTTFLPPITENAADINAIMEPAMEEVMGFDKDPSYLGKVNDQVNAFLG